MDKPQIHLKDNFRTFRMAYMVASQGGWTVHYDMDLFSVKMLSEICMTLLRSFLIEHIETQTRIQIIAPYAPEHVPERLNLFYNRLTDRNGSSTEI